jgi:hypothetical protein
VMSSYSSASPSSAGTASPPAAAVTTTADHRSAANVHLRLDSL